MQAFVHYVLDIKDIDDQHRELYKLVKDVSREKNRDTVVSLLNKIYYHCEHHFNCERDLMLELNYPHAETHIEHHLAFLGYLNRKLDFYLKHIDSNLIARHMVKEIFHEFLNHIDYDDREFAKFYHSNSSGITHDTSSQAIGYSRYVRQV